MDAAQALQHKWLAGEVGAGADKANDGTKTKFQEMNVKRQESRQNTLQAIEQGGGNPKMDAVPEPGKAGCGCVIA